jgi:two-component system sensor histidine kinase FlrB
MSLRNASESTYNGQPLEDAFHAFNQVSQHLTDSYQHLEQQVGVLSQELAKANSEKLRHLSEKESLANQLESLIDALPGAVIVLDKAQKIIRVNACATSWLGTEIIGADWDAVSEQHLAEKDLCDDQFSLSNGRKVALSRTKLTGQSGDIVLLSDITQQQELHKQLAHKKKLAEMGEFSASLAHQIRTPLASALLYASQLNSDALTKEAKYKFSSKLLERLRMLDSQVTDMLRYSHDGNFMRVAVDLTKFVGKLSTLYQDKHINFHYRVDDARLPVEIYVCEDALLGAISNLLDNALDAIGYDVCASCEISVDGLKGLEITVKDNGVGLSLDQQQRIFEPFYTNKTNGTGLGLAVVHEVVSAHAGQINCESKIGVGTTMTLLLPVVIPTSKNIEQRA